MQGGKALRGHPGSDVDGSQAVVPDKLQGQRAVASSSASISAECGPGVAAVGLAHRGCLEVAVNLTREPHGGQVAHQPGRLPTRPSGRPDPDGSWCGAA